ncbi:MAG: NAD(P)H-binding protein [Deltaproteobacteria bacterium]|nr:NAD(P)H-binding protein [Deltaproteobacteria bacterium]
MRTVITGASGFIGARLLSALAGSPGERVAVSRSPIGALPGGTSWRGTDLFSAKSTADALEGADTAVYLVHSMMPSTQLFQGTFHDADLLLADNFARGCLEKGVRRNVYLGGLVPTGHVSPHLQSRLEVGEVLRSTGIPVTELRAGMIVGPGGSSFEILKTLVERLPWMVLPEWTQRHTQAISVDDVVRVVAAAVSGDGYAGQTLDEVNGESLTYETLLRQMAEVLGLKRRMLPVPIRSTAFSKRWVTLFGGASYELVSPLIDSLLCDLPAAGPGPGLPVDFHRVHGLAPGAVPRPHPGAQRCRHGPGAVRLRAPAAAAAGAPGRGRQGHGGPAEVPHRRRAAQPDVGHRLAGAPAGPAPPVHPRGHPRVRPVPAVAALPGHPGPAARVGDGPVREALGKGGRRDR